MERYFVARRGILHLVFENGIEVGPVEESRWEDEEKATEHCRLMNIES